MVQHGIRTISAPHVCINLGLPNRVENTFQQKKKGMLTPLKRFFVLFCFGLGGGGLLLQPEMRKSSTFRLFSAEALLQASSNNAGFETP